MERLILNKLLDWKNSPYRKPLILMGVRQVGKTWVLKEFGRRYYENTVLNIPLFMADQMDRLIGLALEQRQSDTHNKISISYE